MDTSEDRINKRIDGEYSQTTIFHVIKQVPDVSIQAALSDLLHVGKVHVTTTRDNHKLPSHFRCYIQGCLWRDEIDVCF